MSGNLRSEQMAKTRALMTQTERDRIAGVEDVEDIKRYQAITRVRGRIQDELTEDIRILEEHHDGLLDEIREVVCTEVEKGIETDSDPKPAENTSKEPAPDPVPNPKDLRDVVADGLAGSGDLLERRVDEIGAMYEVLRQHGEAENSELLDAVDVDATGYASRESVWSNMVKGKDTLSALPGVEAPPTGRSTWKYKGGSDE